MYCVPRIAPFLLPAINEIAPNNLVQSKVLIYIVDSPKNRELGGTMERSNHLSLIPVILLVLLCLIPIHAPQAAGYSYYVDYFKVQGSVNKKDDFDDGVISPWDVDAGTAVESGGTAILKNPGDKEVSGAAIDEFSEIETPTNSAFNIQVGSGGSATGTSRWITNVKPGVGQYYRMDAGFEYDIYNHVTDSEISFSVGIVNADQAAADFLSSFSGIPIPTGLFAFFVVEQWVSSTVGGFLDFQIAPIADMTLFDEESLFLNLHYDDSTQMVAADIVFGDDENGSAWTPFYEIAMPSYTGDLVFDEWGLEAGSISAVHIPAALPLFCSALSLYCFIGFRRSALLKPVDL
jgi:hypothetical protein